MTAHRSIMVKMGEAVRDATAVLNSAITISGKGLAVHVGAYPDGIPDVKDAPFLWLYASGENESEKADETFTVHGVVGACIVGTNGERVIKDVETARTSMSNGLTVNGANAKVEELRDLCIAAIRAARCGAIVSRISRWENDISHFPLEWAEFEFDFMEPESLAST